MQDRIQQILGFLIQAISLKRDLFYEADEIWQELLEKGYDYSDIQKAILHIQKTSLKTPGSFWSDGIPVHRIYSQQEMLQLPRRVRGYLWKLKWRGVINHVLEDEIIEKAMNLNEPLNLTEIKTVAALTIFGHESHFQIDRYQCSSNQSRLN